MAWIGSLLRAGVLGGLSLTAGPAGAESTAFYYGPSVPRELWVGFDQVVVEPEHVRAPRLIEGRRAHPVAYLSVGEVSPSSEAARGISPAWVLAENERWSSWVMDVANPGYRDQLFARYEGLWAAGYRRFFLDTLDSYELVAMTPGAKARSRAALVDLIIGLSARHPDAKLLLNRGFELLPDVAALVHGVVAESLFDGWDAGAGRYTRVGKNDRQWLLERLREARDRYGLPVTVIDYRPPRERRQARATARSIHALGFEPWVSDGALGSMGVGSVEVIPRRVLIIGDTAADGDLPEPLRLLAPVLEHLGYVPEYRALEQALSESDVVSRYQGVISWLSSSRVPAGYPAWMRAQIDAGVRFAIFGAPGFDLAGAHARSLGIDVVRAASVGATRVVARDELIGFEAEPPARPLDVPLLRFEGPGALAHLVLADAQGGQGAAVATTAWGGAALSHVFAARGLEGERAWVIDPFAFISRALALPSIPIPDVTTEYGRRVALLLIRVRGLGEQSRLPGRPSTLSVVEDRLLRGRGWPHAFDLTASGAAPPSSEDIAAAGAMLLLPFAEASELEPGLTDARGPGASLTHVEGMVSSAPASTSARRITLPIASDLRYLPPNSPESYSYARVLETLEYTDKPRRLKPILLDYHASAASSPGGLATLDRLYEHLDTSEVYPLFVSEYAARVEAFGEQVLLRHLDGSFSLRGGEALRTIRVPVELGFPDLVASRGVASVRRLEQGQYVTFGPLLERRLVLSPQAPASPHVVQSNGVVESFDSTRSEDGWEMRLRIRGHAALRFEVAGLPAHASCRLDPSIGPSRLRAGAQGGLEVELRQRDTGDARLVCRGAEHD